MFRTVLLVFALSFALPAPSLAQDREQTLADIRQELSVLWIELQRLKRELVTTGGPSIQSGGVDALDRINTIEGELSRVIAQTESLENRIDLIVADGTNRIGDLEFRLVELEGGDISQLGETTTLGGLDLSNDIIPPPASALVGTELAVGEQADFDRALSALDAGEIATAADQFLIFTNTYPGGPLSGEAHFWRGEALIAAGDTNAAARAYLDSFSGDPDGSRAPDALLQLGFALNELGQRDESCVMLGEVTTRYPESNASIEALAARGSFGCI